MTLDEYLSSAEFQLFQDEALRAEAVRAVDVIREKSTDVKRHQLHSISSVIQAAGLRGLRSLSEKQKEKNYKNKDFWAQVEALLSPAAASDISLVQFLKTELLKRGSIQSDDHIEDKKEQRQIRKGNNVVITELMEHILAVYFEHFTCHYFFITQ